MNKLRPVSLNTHCGTSVDEVCGFVRFALPTACWLIQNATEQCISRPRFLWESRGLENRVADIVYHYDLSTREAKIEICLRCTEGYAVFQVQILTSPEEYTLNIRQLLIDCYWIAAAASAHILYMLNSFLAIPNLHIVAMTLTETPTEFHTQYTGTFETPTQTKFHVPGTVVH